MCVAGVPRQWRRTTVVTEIEMLQGRYQMFQGADSVERLCEAQRRLDATRDFLAAVVPSVLKVDEASAELLFSWLGVRGLGKIGRRDLLIGAVTVRHDAILVTGNVEHFSRVPRVRAVDWRSLNA